MGGGGGSSLLFSSLLFSSLPFSSLLFSSLLFSSLLFSSLLFSPLLSSPLLFSSLMFSIIFADLDLWINRSTLSNFADDTQSCIIADTPEELQEIVKEESRAVLEFFNGINLVNNPDKAALLYNAKGKASQITIDGIGGETVESKESEKLL